MLNEELRASENIIEEWMLAAFQDGGIETFDDLHIDTINARWNSRQLWTEGGLAALQVAVRLRDRHKLPVEVVLGFSLQSNGRKIGVDFETLDEFTHQLDWTPPSIYLVRPGIDPALVNEKAIKEGQVGSDAVVIELDNLNIFGASETAQRCFYTEFKQKGQTDYCRSVFLQS
jgi:hypothetical protein